jgi:hypothetical protein
MAFAWKKFGIAEKNLSQEIGLSAQNRTRHIPDKNSATQVIRVR